ncbi:MAG: hypothetical protein ACK47B_28880 [Armatimonadota bacterium]
MKRADRDRFPHPILLSLAAAVVAGAALAGGGEPLERRQSFDADPGWDGRNNRSTLPPRTIVQDFGYSRTSHTGGEPGELGGVVTPSGEPAYYAREIEPRSLNDELTASGVFVGEGRNFNVLVGFFNAGTLNEWRTPSSLALRLYGRGDNFYTYVEYCTRKWRAGADSPQGFMVRNPATGRTDPIEFPAGKNVYRWTLRYDPNANEGRGSIFATIGDRTARCDLDPGHKQDGATFNRFGLLNVVKSADGGGEVWLDDLTVNGETERFDRDPRWDARRNRQIYASKEVRFRFDFGWSRTGHAGGTRTGEIGGLLYRGDGRDEDRIAYYADRVGPLTLQRPIRAAGRISFHRGVSDSTTLFGFFHSTETTKVDTAQATGFPDPFLGVALEGPSSEGFLLYPAVRIRGDHQEASRAEQPNRIYPDGTSHSWSLEYTPGAPGQDGQMTVRLDGNSVTQAVPADFIARGKLLDRFGFITTRVDGNAQVVYLDDLVYTAVQ